MTAENLQGHVLPPSQAATLTNDQLLFQGLLFSQLFEFLPIAVAIWRFTDLNDSNSLEYVRENPASLKQNTSTAAPAPGQRMIDFYGEFSRPLLDTYLNIVRSGTPINLGEVSFGDQGDDNTFIEMQAFPLPENHLAVVHTNITERKRAEAIMQRNMQQEAVIQAQNAVMAELSTPLIPISNDVTVMPLIGLLDSSRAQQVISTLLEGVSASQARFAILDITGVPVVDTQVANVLVRAAQAVKLLGATVILTGIRPEVAQTLVGLGADLSAITTHSTLQSGIAYATQIRARSTNNGQQAASRSLW